MARHQQTTNHSSVVQYNTIFISDHSNPWWTEKPSSPTPPFFYVTYFTVHSLTRLLHSTSTYFSTFRETKS